MHRDQVACLTYDFWLTWFSKILRSLPHQNYINIYYIKKFYTIEMCDMQFVTRLNILKFKLQLHFQSANVDIHLILTFVSDSFSLNFSRKAYASSRVVIQRKNLAPIFQRFCGTQLMHNDEYTSGIFSRVRFQI